MSSCHACCLCCLLIFFSSSSTGQVDEPSGDQSIEEPFHSKDSGPETGFKGKQDDEHDANDVVNLISH